MLTATVLVAAHPTGAAATGPEFRVPSRTEPSARPDVRSSWLRPAPTVRQIVLVGDSLAQEVAGLVGWLVPGKPVVPKFWGGTAPCDWTGVDLGANRSTVVVITFTGNSLTRCMQAPDGTQLRGDALVDRYRIDITTLVAKARRAGARVVLVGQPYRDERFGADAEVDGINAIYRSLAKAHPYISFVDAGAAVEDADGHFTERLPCLPVDSDCAADGTTLVRSDGVHFCPIVGQNPCSIWASGAFRFGAAIAAAVRNPRAYE